MAKRNTPRGGIPSVCAGTTRTARIAASGNGALGADISLLPMRSGYPAAVLGGFRRLDSLSESAL